jgi:hypothetical protein
MAEINDSNQRTRHGTTDAAQDLVVDRCTIHATDDRTWYVTAQLAANEQLAL